MNINGTEWITEVDHKLALKEATQPLLERVKELEQVADIGDDLMNKQLERIDQLQSQLTTLEAACADMREALNTCIAGNGGHWFDKSKVAKALSSTSGQRILEENRRMRELLEKFKLELTPHSFCSRVEYEAVQRAIIKTIN